jgi:hypothetical protein
LGESQSFASCHGGPRGCRTRIIKNGALVIFVPFKIDERESIENIFFSTIASTPC